MKHSETKMVALKSIRYKMKRIAQGEEFMARDGDVRVLQAVRHATLAPREMTTLPEMPASLKGKVSKAVPTIDEDIKALREEYFAVIGKKPFNGWDAAALREKIAEARAA